MKRFLLIACLALPACNTPMTPQQQAAAMATGLATANVLLDAKAKGKKLDGAVYAEAAQAGLAAGNAVLTTAAP